MLGNCGPWKKSCQESQDQEAKAAMERDAAFYMYYDKSRAVLGPKADS